MRAQRARRWRAGSVVFGVLALSSLLVATPPAEAAFTPAGAWGASLYGAIGLDADPLTGDVWAVSGFANTIQKFDENGTLLLTVGGFGSAPGQFNLPSDVAVDSAGDVYVIDIGNSRVQRFDHNGTYLQSYGSSALFSNPRGIAIDAAGNVLVADVGVGKVYEFAPGGTLSRTFSSPSVSQPFSIAVDHDGNLWTGNFGDGTVRKLDATTGAVLASIGGFGQPTDIDVDAAGNIFVVDFNTATVRSYTPAGTFLASEALQGSSPAAITFDRYGRLISGGGGSGGGVYYAPPRLVTDHSGPAGGTTATATFAAATASHVTSTIDFDGDGFDSLAPHAFTPIPSGTYAGLGVTVLGLDARSVDSQPWAHSPPIGAWQHGFSNPTSPYSFVFTDPVASFGMFVNDAEGPTNVKVHLADGGADFFLVPASGGANIGRFVGFSAADNVITAIDFYSSDYHIIDDVRFGRVQVTEAIDDTASTTQATPAAIDVLANDTVAPGGTLDVTSAGATDGTVTIGADDVLAYTPPLAFCGPTELTYDISDGIGGTDSATVDVTVTCVDGDGDGVADDIDNGAGLFSDPIAGGPTTSGAVTSIPAGFTVLVEDEPDPAGVRIRIAGPAVGQVTISLCGGFTIKLSAGTDAVATCGSLKVTVSAGSATVVLSDDTELTIPAGATAKVATGTGGTFALTDVVGTLTMTTDGVSRTVTTNQTLAVWDFVGFTTPVDNGGVRNKVKAGQAVPLKWRVVDESGAPVTNLTTATVSVTSLACSTGVTVDALEEVAPGGSGLQNLGNGYYQLNWKTPTSYAGSCKTMKLNVGEGITHDALFEFTR